MKGDKPWYERWYYVFGIIASIFAILGISVASIITSKEDSKTYDENTTQSNAEVVSLTSEPSEVKTPAPITQSPQPSEVKTSAPITQSPQPETPSPSTSVSVEENDKGIGTPFVISDPIQDSVTNAYLSTWDEENDKDIFGNTYTSAIKLTVYNLINAIGGGSSNIVADVHIPLGENGYGTWVVSFVVAQDMVGNGSSANVTILSGEDELFPSFTIDSATTEQLVYEIELEGIRDLIFHFDCKAIGEGFSAGIVLEEKEE